MKIEKQTDIDSMSTMKKSVLQGTAGAFMIRGFSAIAVFAMNVILARLLTLQDYGVVALGFSWLIIAGTVACFGTDTVATRFVAEGHNNHLVAQVSTVIIWTRKISLIVGTAITVLSITLLPVLFQNYIEIQIYALWIMVASIPLFAFSLTSAGVLRGAKRVVLSSSIEVLIRPLTIIALASLVYLILNDAINIIHIATLIFIAVSINAIVGFVTTRDLSQQKPSHSNPNVSKQLFKIAFPLAAMNGMGVLISNLDTIVIGAMVDADSAGIYRASAQIATLVAFGLMASNGIIAPLIAELHSSGRSPELRRILRYSVTIISVASIISVAFIGLYGIQLLGMFGVEYETGYNVLLILLIGQTINALCGPTAFMMSMTGHQNQAMRIFALSTVINIALNLILVPKYGMIGGAIANVVGLSFWNIAILIYLKAKLNIDPSILSWISLIKNHN